eukprot:4740032-Alexandrium_andersonii.AAC.1
MCVLHASPLPPSRVPDRRGGPGIGAVSAEGNTASRTSLLDAVARLSWHVRAERAVNVHGSCSLEWK